MAVAQPFVAWPGHNPRARLDVELLIQAINASPATTALFDRPHYWGPYQHRNGADECHYRDQGYVHCDLL